MGRWLYCLSLSPAVLPLSLSLSHFSSFNIIHHSSLHSTRNPTLHGHGHIDTHCVLIKTCASTNTSCMLVNTFTQTHHRRPQKPLRLWPAPSAHTAHLHGIQLLKEMPLRSHHYSVCLVWGSKGVKLFCACVFSVF